MHKLTPIFIGGALAISAGLAIAQSQLNTDTTMQGHDMPGHSMPASDNPSTQAYIEANNRMHADMTVDFTGDVHRLHARHDPAPPGRDRHGADRAAIRH